MAAIKTITLNSITNEIGKLNLVKSMIEKYLQRKPFAFEEIIFIKYIELQNAASVADYLNESGYYIKISGRQDKRKYISNDITQYFNQRFDYCWGCKYLFDFAKCIYLYYKGKASWNQVIKQCEDIIRLTS